MNTLLKTGVVVCAALMLVMAGCSDTAAPPTLLAPDEALFATTQSGTFEREFSTPRNLFEQDNIRVVTYEANTLDTLHGVRARCAEVTITIVEKIGSRNRWNRYKDPDHTGEICSYAKPAGGNLYHVYYEFTLFGQEEKGRFLAREMARCNKFPCETKANVEVLKDLGDFMGVFANPGFDALVQTFRCKLNEDADGYLLDMTPIGGNLAWTE
jgi:hypothetical protein